MPNPGPSSSSTVNQTALSVSTDIYGKVQNIYGAGSGPIDGISFSKAIAAPNIIQVMSIPTGVAPSGTIGANGALTLGTALDGIYGPTGITPGVWLYFPLGAAFPGALAGLYWCVMTSTTLGTIFNNMFIPPGQGMPPTAPVPIVGPATGSYTGVTTEVAISGAVIKGGSMGLNGGIRDISLYSFNNTANAKTIRKRFGGIAGTAYESISGANNATCNTMTLIYNRNANNFQVGPPAIAFGLSASAPVTSSVDTSVDVQLLCTVQTTTATDWMLCQTMQIENMSMGL